MTRRAFVVGAGGAVGEAAAHKLLAGGWAVTASMHQERDDVRARLEAAGAEVMRHHLPDHAEWARAAQGCDALLLTANLAIARATLEAAELEVGRIVVFSSNNVAADPEAPSYRALADAEHALRARFAQLAIVRPTLIYGDPRLATVTRLVRMARRWPAMALPGSGRARVQPVFHDDLGCLAAGLAEADAPTGVFAAGGPEIVTMRALYAAIAKAAGVSRLVAPMPAALLAAAGVLSAEQAARADADRVAIAQDALPTALAPRTTLREGLAHLVSAMDGSPGGG
ncbi:MAG TPA: NAD(P)H-binding protein [Vitreimonas sp.]|uniref:SDR family oxidoreductase n=1 Tax=Vitreimonas sp. TaxID=3069702 RepID=UPI002D4482BC|nr:NAD(P)H-binding protein [Vitreimonas sp.]HYD87733.1 NAD(P)H-binding protein [Vitreimonas sp.]